MKRQAAWTKPNVNCNLNCKEKKSFQLNPKPNPSVDVAAKQMNHA